MRVMVSRLDGTRSTTFEVDDYHVSVGSDPACSVHIQNDRDVSARHLVITTSGDLFVVQPLSPTRCDGAPMTGTWQCRSGTLLQIGSTLLLLQRQNAFIGTFNPPRPAGYPSTPHVTPPPPQPPAPPPPPPPPPAVYRAVLANAATEQRLLEDLRSRPDNPGTRVVYADWLEERGALVRARIVRGDEALEQRDIVEQSDPQWRAIASCQRISCPEAGCPRSWSRLRAVSGEEHVRSCAACGRLVRYCFVRLDWYHADRRGERVVSDASDGYDPTGTENTPRT